MRRTQPHGCSTGDEVVVRLEPGLLALLRLRDARARQLGDGLAAEWWLGLGAAATAATRAGDEARGWAGVSFSVRWTRPAAETETLLAGRWWSGRCPAASARRRSSIATR